MNTMLKLSLVFSTAAFTWGMWGCGTDAAPEKKAEEPKPAETPPVPNTAAPTRQLIEGNAQATTPVNLLADPGFSLSTRQDGGYGAFVAFYGTGQTRYTFESSFDSRAPSGFGGNVGWIRPEKATDTSSKAITALVSFLGGKGPFRAKVWASKTDVKGVGVDLPTDGSAVKVSIADGSPESTDAYDLRVDDSAAKRVVNGMTWVLLRVDVPKPLENGGFFIVETGTNGGHIALAAPEVTSDELRVGQAIQKADGAKIDAFRAIARTKTSNERSVIAKYKAIPPKLIPAGAQPKPNSGLQE